MSRRRHHLAAVAAVAVAGSLLAAGPASATTRYAAPGGTATPAQCVNPAGPYCSIGTAAGGTGVTGADEAIILPGAYSDTAGDLDGDGTNDGMVNAVAGSVHGVLAEPRPVVTIADPGNPFGAFFLSGTNLGHVTIENAVSEHNLTAISVGAVVDGVIARNTSASAGVIACNHTAGIVRNSVCSATGSGAIALGADVGVGGTPNPIVRGVTAVSTGTGSFGMHYRFHSFSPGTGPTATISAKSVIAQGTQTDVRARATGTAQTSTTINLDHSAFDTSDAVVTDGATATVTPAGTGAPNFNVIAAPLLAADGYHQLAGSPTINAGQTDASSGTTDIDGQARQIGLAAPDIGADESAIASATALACAPSSLTLGAATTCTATVTAGAEFLNGEIDFASDGAGAFASSGSCALVIVNATTSRCEIAYTPSAVGSGTHGITATYAGDGEHDGSQGSAGVTVVAPNPVQAKKKCKKGRKLKKGKCVKKKRKKRKKK